MTVHTLHDAASAAHAVSGYLARHERTSLLRFITCGSVDDGKSTLIGRLLYESKMLFEDQLAALEADSKKVGTQGGGFSSTVVATGSTVVRQQMTGPVRRGRLFIAAYTMVE